MGGNSGSKVDNYSGEATPSEEEEEEDGKEEGGRGRRDSEDEEKYGRRHSHDPEFSGPIHVRTTSGNACVSDSHISKSKSASMHVVADSHIYFSFFRFQDRSCTDVLCLLLFVAFLVCWLVAGIWAFTRGDPNRLIYPSNSRGEVCGKGDYR